MNTTHTTEDGFSLLELVITLAIGLTIVGTGATFYIQASHKLEQRAIEVQQMQQDTLTTMEQLTQGGTP